MVVSQILVLSISVVERENTDAQTRTSLQKDLLGSLDELGGDFLQPVLVDVLLERREVLGNLAVNLDMLLPQL